MAVTSTDIANKVGLSQSTVSRILNAAPGYSVSAATRQRVLDAARDMGYYPNVLARSLIHRRVNTIGFYWSGRGKVVWHHPYLFRAYVEAGLYHGCTENKIDLLYHGSSLGRTTEETYAEIHNGKVDGIIVFASSSDALAQRLTKSYLPVVNMIDANPDLPSVVADDSGAGRLMAEHIAGKGHRRLIYRMPTIPYASADRRYASLTAFAAANGIEVRRFSTIGGSEGVLSDTELAWLNEDRSRRPTAIICWNDGEGHSTMKSIKAMGLDVPGDVAIYGFDGLDPLAEPKITLTSVRLPWLEVTRAAVSLLVRKIGGEEIPGETVVPQLEMVFGDTG